jgi:hypothetical protein
VEELVPPAAAREPLTTAESAGGNALERVTIDGERFVLKTMHVDDDWIQRAAGDIYTGPLTMWRSGRSSTWHAVSGGTAGVVRS